MQKLSRTKSVNEQNEFNAHLYITLICDVKRAKTCLRIRCAQTKKSKQKDQCQSRNLALIFLSEL
jgi:hypothetical protein